jgi:hypothetical protein
MLRIRTFTSGLNVVRHGIEPDDGGRYDLPSLGDSSILAERLPLAHATEEARRSIACGVLTGGSASMSPSGGGSPVAPTPTTT